MSKSKSNHADPLAQALLSEEARLGSKFNHRAFMEDMHLRISTNADALQHLEPVAFRCRVDAELQWLDPDGAHGSLIVSIRHFLVDEERWWRDLPAEAIARVSIAPFKPGALNLISKGLNARRIQAEGPEPAMAKAWRSVAAAIARSEALARQALDAPHDLTPLADILKECPSSSISKMSPQDIAIFEEERHKAVSALAAASGPKEIILQMAEVFQARMLQAEADETLSFRGSQVSEDLVRAGSSCAITIFADRAAGVSDRLDSTVALSSKIVPFGKGMSFLAAKARLALLGPDAFIERSWAIVARDIAKADAKLRSRRRLPAPAGLRSLVEKESLDQSCPESAKRAHKPRSL